MAILRLLLTATPARAEEDDLPYLELFNGTSVETVSADRSPRPASQTAENITVVTAKEIEALNAHTLADVLYTVTGVQLEYLRTPGTLSNIEIQGAVFNHILVLLDNVPINNLADNYPDIASVPVQMIERIEVVKGADSSSWGNALGGVVNVITKSPQTDRPFGALVSASVGEHGTTDVRGETSGTVNRLGYYLTAVKLNSGGLLPNNSVNQSSAYGKITWDLLSRGMLTFTTSFTDNEAGNIALQRVIQGIPFEFTFGSADNRQVISTVSLQTPLTDRINMDASARTRLYHIDSYRLDHNFDSGITARTDTKEDEESYGASVKFSWYNDLQRIAAGVDYDHVWARVHQPQGQTDLVNNTDDRVGAYLNDTFTFGHFAVTPSARFDHTDIGGNLLSPSFGITYAVTDNTVLRGYTAKGYSLTSLNRDNSTEKVWTSQVGFESADIPFLWVKGTAFRNDTWDINVFTATGLQKQRQLKRGLELETRTLPYFDTSLSLGYTYIDATNADTGAVLASVPRHTLNLGIKYENSDNLRALLFGRYVDWNTDPPSAGKYGDIIWDLHLGKKVRTSDYGYVELFASVRNLFNGNQYISPFVNPRRWAEVGVRCAF